ncbi:MAG: HAMP domain-containing histidine kinase [Clostridia bacterium]|nr:HAMP domain-containing histidine kinase [Clostridia bacterium]
MKLSEINIEELKEQFRQKQEEGKKTISLTLSISFALFVALIVVCIVAALIIYVLIETDTLPVMTDSKISAGEFAFLLGLTSLFVGFFVALLSKKILMRTIDSIVNQINRLAYGDYSVRLKVGKPFKRLKSVKKITDSFNKMAEELQSTEMLRSDFINNFSHEFKTPIVSISGFVKLLKKENITEKQRNEYLCVIEEESIRLSQMATSILNLTKIENQNILTDISKFNLSEQIRNCILMLESKWEKKKLELNIDFGEHEISANYEMLKQVWINLIDNAIKFSDEYGILEIKIHEENNMVFVSVSNSGVPIEPDKREKIFNKFYQAEESHSSNGHGIGLAIVKRVIQLHMGAVSVNCLNGLTTFTVALPGCKSTIEK